jgi:peptidoglycan/LPS O-acetylase OafA/YrhL
MRSKREYFANLDMLRFLAALWVVITHYGYIGPATGVTGYGVSDISIVSVFFKYGFLGVPLFFILSGFVISHVSANSNGWKDAPQFMANRISRLMPAFWACMTISVIALMVFGLPDTLSIATWAANLILLPQILGQPFVDGVLTFEEVNSVMADVTEEVFNNIDLNQNGALDQDEFAAAEL